MTVLKAVPVSHKVLNDRMLHHTAVIRWVNRNTKAWHDSSQGFAATQWQSKDPRIPDPTKQSYPSWKENVMSGSFGSSQLHREISTACGVTGDICCCSWQRHNVLGREKGGVEGRWKPPCSPMGEWTLLLFSMGADCCHIWKSDCFVIC